MKKHTFIVLIILLWASIAAAQQAPETKTQEPKGEVFEGNIGPTYNWVNLDGSSRASEYEYLKNRDSIGTDLHIEYDPLPNRFSIETHYLNSKDYFGEMDYAYRDVVLFNFLARGVYHNLDHVSLGVDDPATTSPSFTDLNPGDTYAIENTLRKGFIRFKTPDFPFHLYADMTTIDRTGTIQQRFLRSFTSSLDKVSESRDIDWSSEEIRTGLNSHLGPVEVDYSHTEKKFSSSGTDRVLSDMIGSTTLYHNLVPDLKSSVDTIKIHTSLTGRIVASASYADGTKKNSDSNAKTEYQNSAGDLTLTPLPGLVISAKYRHYDTDNSHPDTITMTNLSSLVSNNTFSIRDSISSKRDVVSGLVRYRVTPRLTVKGEYVVDAISRDLGSDPSQWDVAQRTSKFTGKLGLTYRMMSKLFLTADYSATQVENPAYADDPDHTTNAKATVTWSPLQQVIALVSYGDIQEKRSDLTAPTGGGNRKVDRTQTLGSLTFLVGKGSSITASYMYYQNKTKETLTWTDESGNFILEDGVPYSDKAQVLSLSGSQALSEGIVATIDASKCFSKGNFRVDGSVAGTSGIDTLSDLNVVEDIYTAGLEVQFNRNTGSDLRYQYRQYDDRIDNTQDGRVNTAMATFYVKW